MTNREEFLERMPTPEARRAAERLMRVAEENGARIYWGEVRISIRWPRPLWKRELSVAWISPRPGERLWMTTRNFSFGAGNAEPGFFEQLPAQLRECLEAWADSFSRDGFGEDVSRDGLTAWAISHADAAANIDLLAERLRNVLIDLQAMG